MDDYVIRTENLTFSYSKDKLIVDHLNINVPSGSIYGFLGPNGAGKSTTMQLLTGILTEYTGSIEIFGKSLNTQIPNIFNRLGVLVETPSLYYHLTGFDNLRVVTTLKNISENKIDEVLKLVGLSENGKQKVKQYSLGMRQRLAIGMTLLGEPELLFLDEPVNGLDPGGIAEIRNLLLRLTKEKNITVFISSHLLSEIEKMCSHVAILNKGRLIYEGTMKQLSEQSKSCQVVITSQKVQNYLPVLNSNYEVRVEENNLLVALNSRNEIPELVKFFVEHMIPIYEIRITDDLEQKFLYMTDTNNILNSEL